MIKNHHARNPLERGRLRRQRRGDAGRSIARFYRDPGTLRYRDELTHTVMKSNA